jgi:hypothetical protein
MGTAIRRMATLVMAAALLAVLIGSAGGAPAVKTAAIKVEGHYPCTRQEALVATGKVFHGRRTWRCAGQDARSTAAFRRGQVTAWRADCNALSTYAATHPDERKAVTMAANYLRCP